MQRFPLDQIVQADCIQAMQRLPENSVDLVFADPPYNLQLQNQLWRPNQTKVDAVNDDWDRFGSFAEYDAFTRSWLAACRRILKPTGTIWVIGTYHNIFRVGAILQDLGFWILNDVVWIKTNPMPNFRGVRLTNAHETIIWAAKKKGARYTFNHHALKVYNNGKQLRSDWRMPICSGPERIKAGGRKAHPTQKPEALIERIIVAASKPDDVILDPFVGSGTTAAVAKRLHRHWLGFEKEAKYVAIARRRIERVVPPLFPQPDTGEHASKQPRIPFRRLLEAGLLKAGQPLYFDADRRRSAHVTPDGGLRVADFEGSIHQAANRLSAGSPCNGWLHWFFETNTGALAPINLLRTALREGT